MALRLHLLGAPYVEKDDARIELTSSKAVALLAYLSVAGHPIHRERILMLLWPESTDESGRKNLRNTLWSIRRALEEDAIVGDGDQLRANESIWSDVQVLQRLDEATSETSDKLLDTLISGVLLEGFNLNDAPDFELWLTGERERIGQMYLRAIARQLERHRGNATWEEGIATAHKALTYDYLQEPVHRYLMETYARIGKRTDALRQYELLSKALLDELGVEPLPDTEALKEAILAGVVKQSTESLRGVVEASPRPASRRQPTPGGAPLVPYVGRVEERKELDRAYQRARAGRGEARIVLITGEMGIGKSRLWAEWSATLPPELAILEARGLESTQTLPFAPLIELLGSNACLRRIATTSSAAPSIWLAEVARVIPALRTSMPSLPPPATLPFDEERRRLFEAFAYATRLTAIDGQPVLLFVDDLHWVDQAFLDWLDFFVHRMTNQGLLLVLAYRPEDATTAVARLIAGWNRAEVLHRIALQRLTAPEAKSLVQSLGGDPDLAQKARAQSAGNPYFLIELCRAGYSDPQALPRSSSVPPVLSEIIRSRLNRLPHTAHQVLQAASVLEPNFDFATLRRVSGRGEEETLDALDAILEMSVVVEKSGLYSFAQPLVAAVVRDGLGAARKSFLHRRAAEAIESTHIASKDAATVAAQLMTHFAAGGDTVRAAYYADIAAARALELAAPAEAIELCKQAFALAPTPQRQINLGRALQRSNELAASRAAFELAYQDFVKQGDLQGAGRACLELAELSLAIGRVDQVLLWVEKGLSYLNLETDPVSHSLAHFLLAAGRSQGGEGFAEAEMHLTQSVDIARENNLPSMAARSRFEMGNLLAQRGDLPAALAAYRDAMSYAEQASDTMQVILAHNNFSYHALLSGRLNDAREHINQAIGIADAAAIQMPLQYLYSTRGEVALAEKQWDEAEQWFKRGIVEAEKAGNTVQAANYTANLGLTAQGRGDYDSALILFEAARASAQQLIALYLLTQIDLWLADLHLLRGEPTAAEQTIRRIDGRVAARDYQRLLSQADRIRALLTSK